MSLIFSITPGDSTFGLMAGLELSLFDDELEDSSHQSLRKYVSAVATVTFVICCRRKEKTTIWMPSSRQYKRCSIKDRLHELGFCQRAWLHC